MIAAEAKMLTYEQVAERLNFTHKHRVKTVARLVLSGKLEAHDFGPRTKRVSELQLQKYLNGCRTVEKKHGKRFPCRN